MRSTSPKLPLLYFANQTEAEIAEPERRTVVAIAGRNTLVRCGLIPTPASNYRQAGRQTIDVVRGGISYKFAATP